MRLAPATGWRSRRSCRYPEPDLFDRVLTQLAELPPLLVYLVLGLLAAVENLFPPVPADTAVALGAFLSRLGALSPTGIFLIVWFANVTSAILVYVVARTYGRGFFTGRIGSQLLKPKLMKRIERLYERYGTWGIFLSRFVPGARAVIAPFAGVAGLPALKAVPPVMVASAIWYGGLTYAAASLVQELDGLARFLTNLNRSIVIGLVTIITLGSIVWWRTKRAK